MELGLRGKRAFVTGASQGIGLAIAKELASEGAEVLLASRNLEKLGKAAKEISGKTALYVLDLGQPKQISEVISQLKHIDILVNNVGGPAAGNPLDISLEDWDRGYQSILRSVMQLTQGLIPTMREQRWGRILTITSTAAREFIPKLPVSSTFRAALSAYAKSVAKEVGEWGVLINNLLPGPTNTERLTELAHKSPDFYRTMEHEMALKRIAEPSEIARIATFLCSNANGVITGADILADGGYTKAI